MLVKNICIAVVLNVLHKGQYIKLYKKNQGHMRGKRLSLINLIERVMAEWIGILASEASVQSL